MQMLRITHKWGIGLTNQLLPVSVRNGLVLDRKRCGLRQAGGRQDAVRWWLSACG